MSQSILWGDNGIQVAFCNVVTFRGFLVGPVKQFEDINRLFSARKIHPVIDRVFSFTALCKKVDSRAWLGV